MTEEEEFEFRLRFEQEQAASEIPTELPAPLTSGLMPEPEGFQRGLQDPADAAAQILTRAVPEETRKPFDEKMKAEEEIYQAQRAAHGETGIDWPRIGGSVVSTAVPGLGAARAVGPATTAGRVATGATTGAGYGLLTPSYDEDFWSEKAAQGGTGAVMGALFPALYGAGGAAKNYIKRNVTAPWTEAGRKGDIGRFLRGQAGGDREKIISAMQAAREQVPGSRPTSGQAIAQAQTPGDEFGNALVKLEREVASSPSTGAPLKQQYASQRAARKRVIDEIAKTDADLKAAEAARAATARQNYGQAYQQPQPRVTERVTKPTQVSTGLVDDAGQPIIRAGTKTQTRIQSELRGILDDPYVKMAMPDARKMAKHSGITLQRNPTEYIQNIKTGLDRQLMKTGDDALTNKQRGQVQAIKSKLTDWLAQRNRAYEVARAEFARQSVPINRMQVGQELRDALVEASLKERPGPFQTAMRNAPRTIKRATGFSRYDDLGKVLSPEQMRAVGGIADDITTLQTFKNLSSEMKGVLSQLPSEVEFQAPKVLSRPIVIANHALARIAANTQPKYQKLLAETLKDPKKLEAALQEPMTSPRRQFANDLVRELSIYSGVKTTQENQ